MIDHISKALRLALTEVEEALEYLDDAVKQAAIQLDVTTTNRNLRLEEKQALEEEIAKRDANSL